MVGLPPVYHRFTDIFAPIIAGLPPALVNFGRFTAGLPVLRPGRSPAAADLQSVSSFLCTVMAPPAEALSLLRTDINKHEALLSLFGVVSRLRHAKRKSPDFQCFTRQSPVFNSDVAASYAEH